MYNGGKIIVGIIIFVSLALLPFIFKWSSSTVKPEPSLDTPLIKEMAIKQCVESKEYMKTSHMQLLNDWRDSVVRDGKRIYIASDNKQYAMSLQNTCMKCHSNKQKFCDVCHNYVSTKPYCWDCHIAPKEGGV